MKKLILIALFLMAFGSCLNAQTMPNGWTNNYRFRMYAEGAYPSADSVNQNLIDIDGAIKARDTRIDSMANRYNRNDYLMAQTFRDSAIIRKKLVIGNDTGDVVISFKPHVDYRILFKWATSELLSFSIQNGAWQTQYIMDAYELKQNGSLINTPGTLSNVAYKNNDAVFDSLGATSGLMVGSSPVIDAEGFFICKTADDADAPIFSIYFSNDASKLVYKDGLGSVHALY